MEFRVLLGLCCFVLCSIGSAISDDTKVSTSTGILNGKRTMIMKKYLRQFLGVPYAQPPIGDLRFKPPVELNSFNLEIEANQFAPSCYQPPHLSSVISPLLKPNRAEIDEDCLYLNVYVPETNDDKPLAVMVWLPGEGFDYADPQQFDGSYLAVQGKVIVVTVNYRLSAFGFLSAISDEAPGNAGLLDQRLALKWVQKNIAKFGGDPDNVTLFGRFTGSMSAAIHAFSPLSKKEKLFQRIILQSGVPVGDWVFDRNPLNATFQLAEKTNCLFSSLSDIVACLRRLPANILLKGAMSIPPRFRPVYDYHLIYENTLRSIEKSSYEPVDVMVGINNNEGTLCTIALNAMHSPFYSKILHQTLTEADFYELVSNYMMDTYKETDSLSNKLAVYKYTSNKQNSKLREMFVDFCGDIYVTSHMQRLTDLLAEQEESRVYMYEFAHRPSFSIHPSFIKAGHGDDVLFALALPFQLPELAQDEARLTRRMVEAITNFARKGNPNRADTGNLWPQYTIANRQLMTFVTIKDGEEAIEKSSHEDAAIFWHEIIPAAQHRPCPLAPISGDTNQAYPNFGAYGGSESGQEAYFLGSYISAPAAEYLMVGLFCTIVFLLASMSATLLFLYKIKKNNAFQRLK